MLTSGKTRGKGCVPEVGWLAPCALVVAALLLLCPTAQAATWPPYEPQFSAEEDCFLGKWNQYRAENNLPPVIATDVLSAEADGRANYLYNYKLANPLSSESGHDIIKQAPYTMQYSGGEMIAWASDAAMALSDWQNSPDHNAGLLDNKHSYIRSGIGRAGTAWIILSNIDETLEHGAEYSGNLNACSSEGSSEKSPAVKKQVRRPSLRLSKKSQRGKRLVVNVRAARVLLGRSARVQVQRQRRVCRHQRIVALGISGKSCVWHTFKRQQRSVKLALNRTIRLRAPRKGQRLIITIRAPRFETSAYRYRWASSRLMVR